MSELCTLQSVLTGMVFVLRSAVRSLNQIWGTTRKYLNSSTHMLGKTEGFEITLLSILNLKVKESLISTTLLTS